MIEYEFYCAVEKISTRCNPKMYRRCFTSPWDWCRIFTLSFLANTSATLSTNQMLDDNQLRLSYSHLPALQIRYSLIGKISAQPHTSVIQICFPNGNVFFLSLFSLFKNWMHNEVWGCAEILPLFYAETLLAHRDVSSVLICCCDYFFNDSDDWLLWLLFYDIDMKCS